jgi:hypothetical protein
VSEAPQEARPSFGVTRLAEETRERFVREIVARVALPRLVELHLFAPLRQGGMESGIAVLAALLEVPEDEPSATLATPALAPGAAPPDAELPTPEGLIVEPACQVELGSDLVADGDRPKWCDPTDAAAGPPPAAEPAPRAPRLRHTVFTARYRLVLKGPERGRWDVEVREEADAPLISVEAVVRGVQSRAGDVGDPERLDGATVARILGVAGGAR